MWTSWMSCRNLPELVCVPNFLEIMADVSGFGTATYLRTVVEGKQGHASCKMPYLPQVLLYQLNIKPLHS